MTKSNRRPSLTMLTLDKIKPGDIVRTDASKNCFAPWTFGMSGRQLESLIGDPGWAGSTSCLLDSTVTNIMPVLVIALTADTDLNTHLLVYEKSLGLFCLFYADRDKDDQNFYFYLIAR